MSNKYFALLLALILIPFFTWMAIDSRRSAAEIRSIQTNGDILMRGPSDIGASVQYIFRFPEPLFHHTYNTGQIEGIGSASGGAERYHIYGLTQADFKMDALYEFNWTKKWFKEEYSMWAENLRVEFSYNTLNVYVSSDYPEGSCEYNETLAHEKRHLEIHREVYEKYQAELKSAMARSAVIPTAAHPILVTSWKSGKEDIGRIISGVIDPVFDRFKNEVAEEEAKIDTPESYTELRGRCQNW